MSGIRVSFSMVKSCRTISSNYEFEKRFYLTSQRGVYVNVCNMCI